MQRFFVLKYDFSIIKPIEIAARRENRLCLLSLRKNKNPSFPGHAPGKDTLRAANAATKEGANGGKRGGERSEQESVVPRQDKDSRRDGGHAPPQRHLERSAATMKTRFTGRKQNKRSEFCCLPVVLRKGVNGGKREGERSEQESVVPCQNKDFRRAGGHAPPQRHLERSEATMKERFTGRKQPNELLAK